MILNEDRAPSLFYRLLITLGPEGFWGIGSLTAFGIFRKSSASELRKRFVLDSFSKY